MGLQPLNAANMQAEAQGAVEDAITGEIESILLNRMENAGGNIAQLARFRSFVGEALGILGTVTDLIDMLVAGYGAMTSERRQVMRVAAAHGFGYWVFQDRGIQMPRNPPNAFLIAQRASDASDRHVGEVRNNSNYSTDGGLSSADWNIIWQQGVQDCIRTMETRMNSLIRSGNLQRALQARLGNNASIHGQSHEALASQYRTILLAPKFGTPAATAGGFFLSSMRDASDIEKAANTALYRQFPYNPPTA